jgi:hypothetical protein
MPDDAVQHNPESPSKSVVRRELFSYLYTKEMIMDCATLSISDPTQTAIDSLKICKVNDGKDMLFFSSQDGVDTPFAPSSFGDDKGNKQNLDLNCDGEYLEFFTKLDSWAVEYVSLNSVRLLGSYLPIEKVL